MKYKVGDKVKTIGTFGKGRHSVGTIVETNNSNTEYKVYFDDSDIYLWFLEHEFKTVEQLPFPIGTRVKYVSGEEEFATGIFRGQSEHLDSCWAIERSDGVKGRAQNGWWNFDKKGVMEEVKSELSPQLPFPIGTKVKCSYHSSDLFTGIFQGQSETSGDCWAIERDDAATGSGQNDWWNWDKSYGIEKIVTCDTNIASVECDSLTADYSCYTYYGDGVSFYSPSHYNETIKNNKFMSIKNKIKMLMTGEPEKTLINHGILTIDKELTCDGKQLFNEFIENKFKEEFLKGLYEVLKDEKVDNSAQ